MKLTTKQRKLPPKELCRCRTFCLEDTSATGRVCRVENSQTESGSRVLADMGDMGEKK